MIQKKFLCKDLKAAMDAAVQIGDILMQTEHRAALVTFYEKGFSAQEMEGLKNLLAACGDHKLKIAGISLMLVAELLPEGTGIMLNLVLTEEADIEVLSLPCLPGGEPAAAEKLKSRLDAIGNAKAVALFGSNMRLKTTLFMEKSMEGHEDVPLFGTTTIRGLATFSMEYDEDTNSVEQVIPDEAGDEFVAADDVFFDGFVAVIFSGEKLKVKANYALGWKPIGRSLPVELSTRPAKGETGITRIDSRPAVDIYREYLGVYPDEYLISNICEFPFMVERDGINICLIPIESGPEGVLYFMMTVREGEKVRFSFASHDEVLNASRESLESMGEFGPEALFLTVCGNRLSFLQGDAHLEWDGFEKVAPDYVLMHGACELFYHKGSGGILNSAHLAIGMREAEETEEKAAYEHRTVESLRQGRTLSLADRMSTFLDKITSELVDMAERAQKANNAKSAFLSHMSHEIRTPINAIMGMDELILKESSESVTLEYADDIRSACNNLLGIVNDILDSSKIEAGRMNIVPAEYELRSLVKDMYNVVHLRAEDKGLKVVMDIDGSLPSVMFGDSARIKQVITNILTNAVKYTETGTVTFKVKKVSEGGAADAAELEKACPGDKRPDKSVRIRVAVKDTGIGIKPEDLEKLFDEYARFDEDRNRSIEGTGLGMSITKELLELMGSRLTVESTYGEGSEFGFEIMQGVVNEVPIAKAGSAMKKNAAPKKRVGYTAEDARILVVDDTPMNLVIVQELLKNTRICVDTAESGAEALELVKQHAYDVILLDHLMPKMSGPEVLRNLNEMEDNISAGAAVISLTSNAMEDAREEYRKMGFRDYLSKPFRPDELEDMLFYYIPAEKIRTISE
ncbi:MAG: response regulator [Lachnospiraceae bacterium]|nr:response regulator [Lachnospiraceae bacterium]